MLPQHATDHHSQLGADALTGRPVDGHVAPHGLYKLPGYRPKGVVAQYFHGAIVRLQRIVESDLSGVVPSGRGLVSSLNRVSGGPALAGNISPV